MSDPTVPSHTNAPSFVPLYEELDAGIFDRKVSHAIAQTALAVVNAGEKTKKGRITIELEIERIGEGAQVNMTHTLTYVRPTLRGKTQETDKTQTLLYVSKGGKMTITPDTQLDLIPRTRREVI